MHCHDRIVDITAVECWCIWVTLWVHISSLGTGQCLSHWYKVLFPTSAICYVSTRMNRPGPLGHSQGHIPYQGGECFCLHVIHVFSVYNTRPNPLVRGEEGSTAKEHVSKLLLNRVHYRLFKLSLYLAVLHPGINHLFNPLIQPVKLLWFRLQELLLRRKIHNAESIRTVLK